MRTWTVRLVVLCAVVSGLVSLAVAMACSGPGPAGGDYVVGSQTLSSASWIRAANGVLAGGNLTGTAEAGVLRFASGLFSGTVEANAISVTTGITVASLAVDGGVVVTGEVQALNGLQVAGNLTGAVASGLRFASGLISGTLEANAISVTTGITVASLAVSSGGVVTGELRALNGLQVAGNLTGAVASGLRFASGLISGTLEANAISVTTGITVASLAVSSGVVVTGELRALNGLQVAGNLTGAVASGLRFASGLISGTLEANAISVTTGITGATLALSGGAAVTGNLTGGAGSVLRYGVGLISGTLSANAISVTTGITVATLKVAGSGQVTGELTAGNGILAGGTGITGTGAGGGAILMGYGAFTVQVSSALVVSTGMIRAATSATQTVINTQPITPVGSYMRLAAAVAVFTSKVITSLASIGDLCVLQNVGTPAITITDGSYCNLVSTFALGISDTLGLVFDGKLWVEMFRSNN